MYVKLGLLGAVFCVCSATATAQQVNIGTAETVTNCEGHEAGANLGCGKHGDRHDNRKTVNVKGKKVIVNVDEAEDVTAEENNYYQSGRR